MESRKYKGRSVDMLTGSKVVIQHFKEHQKEIIEVRSKWADPYITRLENRIDKAITDYLGLDIKQSQRLATQRVYELQEEALKKLSFFKINIEADFSKDEERLNFLLTNLGFNAHYKLAQTRNQEALIQLLQQFRLNMTTELRAEITKKGTSQVLIEGIKSLATPLQEADVSQETLKASTKGITEEAQTEFNAIYDEIMNICKICSKLFENETVIKEKFTFSRVLTNLGVNSSRSTSNNNAEPDAQSDN